MRLLLTETLWLALGGGILGLALGWASLRGLNLLGADQLPRAANLQIDGVVLLTALAACLVVGALLALPLVWHCRPDRLADTLAVESRGGTTSRAAHRLRHTLIVAQFALAFVLLAGAGLLGLSFQRVLAVPPGFQPKQVLTGVVALAGDRYNDTKQRVAFSARLAQEVAGIPGVASVGVSSSLPFGDNQSVNGITVPGHKSQPGESLLAHYTTGVTGNYFTALGIPLREGRFLTADDTARGDHVCVVDDVFARIYWPDSSALGHQLYNGVPEEGEKPCTIVGVVGAVKQTDLADEKPKGAIYLPYAYYDSRNLNVALRTALPPASLGPALRAAVLRLDPNMPVTALQTLDGRIDESLVSRRSPLLVAAIFAGAALVLAGIGLYGVLAYTVAQRRREIGVRLALGARPDQIRAQFLRLGTRLVVIGVLLGGLGTFFLGRAMRSLLFGVTSGHLGVLAATATILVAIALVACLLPAARAALVPPMEALRAD
ncbi:MAG: ABC transporter permease [Opitutales bacterium]